MDERLIRLYNEFDPQKPATIAQYIDASEARGDEGLAPRFLKRLALSKSPMNFLFSGHIGGGKSSELRHLAHCLRGGHSRTGGQRYFPLFLDAKDYLDIFDVDAVDLLLALVSEIGDVCRVDPELHFELKQGFFEKRFKELQSLLLSDVELSEGELPIGAAKLKVKRLQTDPLARDRVRKALEPQRASVLDEINLVLSEARIAVQQRGFRDLVLIIDSLDRIQRVGKHEDGASSHRAFFIDSAPTLSSLNVHKVFTVPLSLVRASGQQLGMVYGAKPFVLPLVKVERRNHERYENGYETLQGLVRRRLGDIAEEVAFEPDALDYLCRYCGGHVRELMQFLQESLVRTEDLPITLETAKKALRPTIQALAPAVHAAWWTKLAALELSDDQQVDEEDSDIQRMLEETMILEYLNGDDEPEGFEEDAPWYGVHPILREMKSFRGAVDAARKPVEPVGA